MSVETQSAEQYDADREESARYDSDQSAGIPEQYRALSSAAVVALLFGLLSLTALLDYWLIVVPAVGIVWAIIALRQVRERSGELTGRNLAIVGFAFSVVLLFAGPSWVYYSEMSQVPPGFTWATYDALQPNPKTLGEVVPQSAIDLNGKKVYIKGFVYAGSESSGIKNFVLVRDAGTCCFGGNPKVTDRIVVMLDSASMVYTKGIAHVAGTFRVNTDQAPGGIGVVYYHLDNAQVW